MKKRWIAGLLCVLLLFQLGAPVRAAGSVYFVAAEESVLPLTDATMPFWSGGYLYVAASVFTNLDLRHQQYCQGHDGAGKGPPGPAVRMEKG